MNFGVQESLRTFLYPFFMGKAVAENGSCSAHFLRKQLRCNKNGCLPLHPKREKVVQKRPQAFLDHR